MVVVRGPTVSTQMANARADLMKWLFAFWAGAVLAIGASACAATAPLPPVEPNNNRVPAGSRRGDTLVVRLEARLAAWRPNLDADSSVTAQVFAEVGGAPRIPGPLVRVAQGTPVVTSIHNTLDSVVVVHGMRGGEFATDTVSVQPGETREIRWTAGAPGTYLYWGTTTGAPVDDRPIRDSQLTGALVVDPAGVPVDSSERIFVITILDLYPDDTVRNKLKEDVFDRAINGLSWPHTERLAYPVGRTVKWRWLNGSHIPHPMHLHGFHYTVTANGAGNRQVTHPPNARRTMVTELMSAGTTFSMEWTPTRAGHWLMHCHMIPHITPFPMRSDSAHAGDAHDVAAHPLRSMQGLVIGVTTTDSVPKALGAIGGGTRLRLFAQQRPGSGKHPGPHGYVLQRGAEPARDSVEVPGTPLVLTRGQRSVITVVNRLDRFTTVHWHGMELESVYDGVSGWSRTGSAMAPLVAPGDSFTVAFTPPRAGTFIYHTHIEEGPQLGSGMYGALLVLEPGRRHDPDRDHLFIAGSVADTAGPRFGLNGSRAPAPLVLAPGRHRFRLINIHTVEAVTIRLLGANGALPWRTIAKDGADLPPALMKTDTLRARLGVGETYDYEVTLPIGTEARLELKLDGPVRAVLTQLLRVPR